MSASSWDWYFARACEAIDAARGDEAEGLRLLVDRLSKGIPRSVLEDEMRAYIHTAKHRDELEDMDALDVIRLGLGVERKH
jgi:hypothetical protein